MKITIHEEELQDIIAEYVGRKINRQLGKDDVKVKVKSSDYGDNWVEIIVEID